MKKCFAFIFEEILQYFGKFWSSLAMNQIVIKNNL